MVEIRIVLEGGILPNLNDSAATVNNSEKLREAFHKLLSNVINPAAFNLIVEIGAGYKNAAKAFSKYALIDSKTSLLIDLDGSKFFREQKLNELELNESANRVFFMVQEMEAWILSQPEVIEKCYNERYIRTKPGINLKELEPELFAVHPEQISQPSVKLKVLLGRYYSEMKGNIKKKKKYGKLKDAPLFIEHLDMSRLIETFEDPKLLKEHILIIS